MESLLSLSFDNLSSRDSNRISKGLRQIEGLLARLCLSSDRLSPHRRDKPTTEQIQGQGQSIALRELRKDAAFREFFRLQEGFQYNGRASATLVTQRRSPN
nr:hypothetical protein CFP56_53708 [Quercus suber]